MSNVINLNSRRPKPEPPPQFRHPFWERISKMDSGKLLTLMLVAAGLAVAIFLFIGNGPSKEMSEACKPDHYVNRYKVAEGLYKVDCMNSNGQVRSIFQEQK